MWQVQLQKKLLPISTETEQERNESLAAVLILMTDPTPDRGSQVLLTKRTERVETHKGQMSFPGGFREPADASWLATALRETWEEVGMCQEEIRMLGRLDPVWTKNQVKMLPFVGAISHRETFKINTEEVEKTIWLPVQVLLEKGIQPVQIPFGAARIESVGIHWEGELIWGATAKILEQLWTILKADGIL